MTDKVHIPLYHGSMSIGPDMDTGGGVLHVTMGAPGMDEVWSEMRSSEARHVAATLTKLADDADKIFRRYQKEGKSE